MRCPKCGAFLEEGKKNCFMCGASWSDASKKEEYNNASYKANEQNNFYQEQYLRQKEEYKERMTDYRNVPIEAQKGDRDIVDFYMAHKKIINFLLIVLLLVGVGVAVFKIYEKKNTVPPKEPLLGELYFEVDKEYIAIEQTNTSITYSKSGDKGSDSCRRLFCKCFKKNRPGNR